jgi:hypothetical protein
MTTYQSLARLGGVAAVGGAVLLVVTTLLHPLGSDPNDPAAAFAEYAADSHWVWSHLGQFLAVAMLGVALLALASTLEPGPAAAWGASVRWERRSSSPRLPRCRPSMG